MPVQQSQSNFLAISLITLFLALPLLGIATSGVNTVPGELDRQYPKSLTVIFQDGATASENVAEGNTNVADYDVTFQDGASSLSSCARSGPDAADFTSSVVDTDTCRIEFSSPPNYDSPNDEGANNVYNVNNAVENVSNLDDAVNTLSPVAQKHE